MWANQRQRASVRAWVARLMLAGLLAVAFVQPAQAITPIPDPAPSPGSYGLEAVKRQPPPTDAATITTPGGGASYSTSPITVSGLCTTDLLVQVYDNGALVGAVNCTHGSFSLQVSLFTGTNELSATQFDDLAQASPDSNHVTVSYNNADFSAFGTLVTLTSNYGRRAADPGQTLTWPLLLSGGTGPYAFSIDWGDGKPAELKSQATPGEIDISHVYDQSGIYHVTIKVTDKNGVTAFLQVVAIANGTPTYTGNTNQAAKTTTFVKVIWWPAVICAVLLLPAYWLGRRSELVSLHHKLLHDMYNYHDE